VAVGRVLATVVVLGDWIADAERMIEETLTVDGAPQPEGTAAGSEDASRNGR
jgi:hypothetical protein